MFFCTLPLLTNLFNNNMEKNEGKLRDFMPCIFNDNSALQRERENYEVASASATWRWGRHPDLQSKFHSLGGNFFCSNEMAKNPDWICLGQKEKCGRQEVLFCRRCEIYGTCIEMIQVKPFTVNRHLYRYSDGNENFRSHNCLRCWLHALFSRSMRQRMK